MNQQQKEKLESIINQGYVFHFSEYFDKGMNIFRKDIGSFVGFTLLYLLISIALSMIPIVGSITSALITYPLMVGYAIVAHQIDRNKSFEFGTFFKGFDFFTPLLLQYLILTFVSLVFLLLLVIYAYLNLDLDGFDIFALTAELEGLALPILLLMIPVFYLYVSWRWAPYFIVFYKMPYWDAMETSRRMIGKNFWPLLAFMVLLALLMVAGAIGFLIGMVFTIPIGMCVDYAAFADVTRLMEQEDLDLDLTEHFVD